MRGIPLLLLASGCDGIFGLDRPVRAADAAIDVAADTRAVTKNYVQGPTYTNVHDTWIDGVNPDDMHPADGALRWRGDRYALIRFDAIFTDLEIPVGSTIQQATLEISIDSSTDTAQLYESAISWADTVTYKTFGVEPGVSLNELGPLVAAVQSTSSQLLDVTKSLESWTLDPTLNRGWIFVANGSAIDTIAASSNSTTGGRPRLTVMFTPP